MGQTINPGTKKATRNSITQKPSHFASSQMINVAQSGKKQTKTAPVQDSCSRLLAIRFPVLAHVTLLVDGLQVLVFL